MDDAGGRAGKGFQYFRIGLRKSWAPILYIFKLRMINDGTDSEGDY
jgi:hypothetical protein